MLKKILLPISAAAVLSLVACGDSSSSNASNSSDKVTCKVNKNSSSEFKMTLAIPDSGVVTISAVKNKKEVTYSTTVDFDSSLPAKEIKAACEDAKLDNDEDEDASISCKDNSMTITTVLGSELSENFSAFTAELEEECDAIQKAGIVPGYGDDDDDDWDDEPSSSSTKNDDPTKVSCEITQSDDVAFKMTISVPDSGISNVVVNYDPENAYFSEETIFDKSVSEKVIQEACDEAKTDAKENEAEAYCDGNTIKSTTKVEQEMASLLTIYSMTLAEACREIQETGKLPADDEDDWGNDDDNWGWDDGEDDEEDDDDNVIESSSSSVDEHEYYKPKKGCSLDKDSDVWTIINDDSQIVYSFTDAGLKMVVTAYIDAGTSAACENALQEENPNNDGTYEYGCQGPYLTTTTTTFMEEAVNKDGLYTALSEECESL